MKQVLFLLCMVVGATLAASPVHTGGGIPDLRGSRPVGPVNDPRGRLVYYNCEISKLVGPGHNAKVYEETLFSGPVRSVVAKKCQLRENPDRIVTSSSLPKNDYIKKFGKKAAAQAETLGELNASGRGPISGPPRHVRPNSNDVQPVLSYVCGENQIPLASSVQPQLLEKTRIKQMSSADCRIVEELL